MRILPRVALAVMLAAALASRPAAAQRDCCYGAMSPPIFDGARLAAGTIEAAVERTERLGFTFSDPSPDQHGVLGYVRFRRGGIVWAEAAGTDYVGLSARRLQPLVSSRPYMACYPMPTFSPLYGDPHAAHPNTAIGIVGAIAVVDYLDGMAEWIHDQDKWAFGDATREEDLGAEASECVFDDGGFVRLISPEAEDSPSMAWLTDGPGRWIGVVIECDDLAAAAACFDAHGVKYRRVSRGEDALRVDPVETGGVLFEFVTRGWRPRA